MTNSTYHVLRPMSEGLGFPTREEAVRYATRKHEETAAEYERSYSSASRVRRHGA